MIKAVIFDMFETLITHFESPLYMAKQISADIGITEQKFREIWNPTDDDRTLGKATLEEVIEKILNVLGINVLFACITRFPEMNLKFKLNIPAYMFQRRKLAHSSRGMGSPISP